MIVNGEKVATLTLNKRLFSKENNVNVKRSMSIESCAQAKHLVSKFVKVGCSDAPKCLGYFIKCFRVLPEATIWDIYEKSTCSPEIESPIKYFIAACRNQMQR